MILAIDPGNIESGYVVLSEKDLKPLDKGKVGNEILLDNISMDRFQRLDNYENINHVAIEMIASYGMPVGAEVFDTCVWIGRFMGELEGKGLNPKYIFRKDEKLNLCQSMKANDATIKQALVDRFAKGEKNYGKGTKKEPGFFYGFKADIWAAMAVGVTYYDIYIKPNVEKY